MKFSNLCIICLYLIFKVRPTLSGSHSQLTSSCCVNLANVSSTHTTITRSPETIRQFKQLDPGPPSLVKPVRQEQEVSQESCWLYVALCDSECCLGQCWDTGTIGLSLEMRPLRFYTDDKASTNFKQLPSELPWIAFVLCLLQYQHDQKTFAKFCQKHNQKNAFTILVPPRLAYISGRGNKMCPWPGITLGLIIQNCHKAIATKKRMIYLPAFYLELLARCRLLLQSLVSTAVLQSAITKIVIRHHPSHGASGGIMLHRHRLHWHLTMPLLSLLVSPGLSLCSLQTIFTRSASTQFKPNQDHDISCCAIKVLS